MPPEDEPLSSILMSHPQPPATAQVQRSSPRENALMLEGISLPSGSQDIATIPETSLSATSHIEQTERAGSAGDRAAIPPSACGNQQSQAELCGAPNIRTIPLPLVEPYIISRLSPASSHGRRCPSPLVTKLANLHASASPVGSFRRVLTRSHDELPTRLTGSAKPKFEGYKLQALDQSELVAQYHLPVPSSQATVSGRSLLSFQEVSSRIKHNHLAIGHGNAAAYIDAQGGVHTITVYDETEDPVFRKIFEIPQQITTSKEFESGEYPTVIAVALDLYLLSDGWGRFYVLRVHEQAAELEKSAELILARIPSTEGQLTPCRLHYAALGPENELLLTVSVKESRTQETQSGTRREAVTPPRFKLLHGRIIPTTSQVEILSSFTGEDIPIRLAFDADSQSLNVVSTSPYWVGDTESSAMPSNPKPDEYAPVPRAGENLDVPSPPRPPPYSWTQTEDTVTVAFPLPSIMTKHQIKVHFSPKTLSLSIQDLTGTIAELSSVPLPHYTLEELWDGVSPASCFWTWDSAAQKDQTYGLLSLHIDKQHEGRKWMHVFARAAQGGSDDVPETVDPSELWNIREALEKYTSDLGGPSGRGGLGFAGGDVPSLADGEMDDEVDSTVGQQVIFSTLALDGISPPATPLACTVLSLALPGILEGEKTLVLKHGIDGVLYERAPSDWTHTATFPAIAFVLASKRDLRFIYHVSRNMLIAFESGINSSGNAYIYHGAGAKEKWAAQAVLKTAGGDSGALLGVGAVRTPGGKPVLLCLGERQLTVVKNLL
ncbi:hypothetical protein BKA62DRAFT_790099 [Auriculariales sp. MPI-PUGE-AT-0066]|nr:hypothetical protein BKA62DRAFT_790099 [Auriculariales sp. MPI-PUGE-AT-0066]